MCTTAERAGSGVSHSGRRADVPLVRRLRGASGRAGTAERARPTQRAAHPGATRGRAGSGPHPPATDGCATCRMGLRPRNTAEAHRSGKPSPDACRTVAMVEGCVWQLRLLVGTRHPVRDGVVPRERRPDGSQLAPSPRTRHRPRDAPTARRTARRRTRLAVRSPRRRRRTCVSGRKPAPPWRNPHRPRRTQNAETGRYAPTEAKRPGRPSDGWGALLRALRPAQRGPSLSAPHAPWS